MKTTSATDIFQFLRGALRGAFGNEDLRGKNLVFIGMNSLAQEVLGKLCLDDVGLYFKDPGIQNYRQAFTICGPVQPWLGETADVVLDFTEGVVTIKNRQFYFQFIGEDAYNQGIGEYYL